VFFRIFRRVMVLSPCAALLFLGGKSLDGRKTVRRLSVEKYIKNFGGKR